MRNHGVMALPFSPPLDVMLARLSKEIPAGEGWLYEPKWDGFRALVFRDSEEVHVQSRDRKPLERYFPELLPALQEALPQSCVVDGEVVVTTPKGLAFDLLQMRIHPAQSRVTMLSEQYPVSYVAFDLLALGSQDLRETELSERRQLLEDALGPAALPPQETRTSVVLSPQTADPAEAQEWFMGLEKVGLDGIIAKRAESLYLPGKRAMIKVKHQRTADCVVGGYRLSKTKDGVASLLLGLYDDEGTLHYIGHTSSFNAAERRRLLAELAPLEGGESFGGGRAPGGPSRWAPSMEKSWVSLEPVLVVEVTYDYLQGDRFRHATGLVRWRDDKEPRDCTFEQLTT